MAENSDNPVPFAEPPYLRGLPSPYYSQSHIDFQKRCRRWIHANFTQHAMEWEKAREVPDHVFDTFNKANMLLPNMPAPLPVEWCKRLGIHEIQGVKVEDWDYMHTGIYLDEMGRCAIGGPGGSLNAGFAFGIPPIVKYGSRELQERFLPDLLTGKKRACIAVTEPDAGSDVANVATTAVKTPDGKHYIINGAKKWITNGIWSDYFTTAVRTGGPGMNGVSLLLIERSEGVSTRRMDCQGVWSSGTTYITFEDVKVPVENLLGKQNQGFRVIMTNFNHERMGIIIQSLRFARVCYEESVKYANKRRTFGKKLMDHPVIRMKLAHMARQIEASYNWLESLIYQCEKMGETEAMLRLGGPIASLKAQSTITFEFCAREASQIFGGLSYSRGGQGGKVERLYRDVRAYAIPGGSEEIMLDLSMRQSMRVAKAMGMKL